MLSKYNQPIRLFIFLAVVFQTAQGWGCSAFCIDQDGQLLVGRSYDWGFGEGMVVVNKRHQFKTAFRYWSESSSGLAQWTSRYGSITFVQYGRDIAFGGMNEAGLVVNELWLDQTQYPDPDARPSISVDQYTQYILDNYSRVEEIVETDTLIRLRPTDNNFTRIHFVAFDRFGDGISIDFLDGEMIYHLQETMPVKAITNDTYEDSLAYFNQGHTPSQNDLSSLARFYHIADMAAQYEEDVHGDSALYAFQILDSVRAGTWTKFQTVFDIKAHRVYFKSLVNPNLRYFDFDALDFSCATPSMILDINAQLTGDVTQAFTPYSTAQNEALIREAWIDLGYTDIYQPSLRLVSHYPESFVCTPVALPDPNGLIQNQRTLQRFSSVQSAIFYAMSHDVIQLEPSIYCESIDLSDKELTLQSLDPNDPYYIGGTIIQGYPNAPVITLTNNTHACQLAGLTLRAGAIGISGTATYATIRNCRIMDNIGHGVDLYGASPTLSHCLITSNGEHGINMQSQSVTTGTGRQTRTTEISCQPVIENCIIVHNGDSAIEGGEPVIVNSIID